MPERPRPDIDHTREALREHDDRAPAEPDEASEEPSEDERDDED